MSLSAFHGSVHYPGLYYRDLDPVSTPTGYQDVLFLRGPHTIAQQNLIQLDSLWKERFDLYPSNAGQWASHERPIRAALEFPNLSSINYGYWADAHTVTSDNQADVNSCITYTRPILVGGVPIGVMGIEVQLDQLKKYFPASDFGESSESGYMLLRYDTAAVGADQNEYYINDPTDLLCDINLVTGSYITRMLSGRPRIQLAMSERENVYKIANADIETPVRVVLSPIQLYNSNAPYSNEKWVLAAIVPMRRCLRRRTASGRASSRVPRWRSRWG